MCVWFSIFGHRFRIFQLALGFINGVLLWLLATSIGKFVQDQYQSPYLCHETKSSHVQQRLDVWKWCEKRIYGRFPCRRIKLTERVGYFRQRILLHETNKVQLRSRKTKSMAFQVRIEKESGIFGPHAIVGQVQSCKQIARKGHWDASFILYSVVKHSKHDDA